MLPLCSRKFKCERPNPRSCGVPKSLPKFSCTYSSKRFSSTTPFSQISTLVSDNGRSSILLEGVDCKKFLQGLMTNDILSTKPQNAIYSSFLNPQGRVLFDGLCYLESDDKILLHVHRSVAEEALKHLQKYKFRSKVQISLQSTLKLWAIVGKDSSSIVQDIKLKDPTAKIYQDPRSSSLGYHLQTTETTFPKEVESYSYDVYRTFLHWKGVMDGASYSWGQSLPLECNLQFQNGVNFQKGCYIGQELTARTFHTGVTRKRVFPLVIETAVSSQFFREKGVWMEDSQLFPSFLDAHLQELQSTTVASQSVATLVSSLHGELLKDEKKSGKIQSTSHNCALSLLRLEFLEENIEESLFVSEEFPALKFRVISPFWWKQYLLQREQREKILENFHQQ